MTTLRRKLLRDLWHHRGPGAAVALVVACGITSFVVTRSAYHSILLSRDDYYARYRFADVFVSAKRVPDALFKKVAAIPGVAAAEARVVVEVALDVPGLAEPATGRLVSIPDSSPPALNRFLVRRGRAPEPGRRDEVLVSEAFASANRLSVGDRVGAVLNGRWESLRIVGIALSPEYVYEIRGAGSILPDNRRFGVLWMSREAVGSAFDMEGGFNDVALTLAPGASEPAVIDALDRLFDRYGSLGAYGRADQVSNAFLDNELTELRTEGWIVPAIFLGVAVFLLHVVVTRLVHTQRDQVAILKALGYGNRAIGAHYLEFVLAMTAAGAVVGVGAGVWLGSALTRVYTLYFRFPMLRYDVGAAPLLLSVAGCFAAAALGALGAVRNAVALQPAEAMRPEPPARFRAGALERIGLGRVLRPEIRMMLRNLLRRPVRLTLSVVGVALAVAILVLGRYFWDMVHVVLDNHFNAVERQEATVGFTNPVSGRAAHEISRLPGVIASEVYRVVPVRLRSEQRSKRTALLGLDASADLRRVVDRRRRAVALPPEGLVLSARLAKTLGVAPGDRLTVEVLEGERPVRSVAIASLVDELLGVNAYMELGALHRLLQEEGALSGAYLTSDPRASERLYAVLKRTPAVAGTALQKSMIRSFEDTIAQLLGTFTAVLVGLASVIALAIVYNGARIALSERGRELASLRVLGFARREVATILLGEQAIITALAIPLGCAMGFGACALLSALYETDLMRMPLVVEPRSYVFSALTVGAATFLSGLVVVRRVARLDLVAVLKTRE
ncbi:MAG TPA: ABC transporter permease [Thermoanaerobaculia bacterium]|nr:ABC transporter permease [Thermoanaerobaculia bacterium]